MKPTLIEYDYGDYLFKDDCDGMDIVLDDEDDIYYDEDEDNV
tara:strand:+ start:486 stop:611 length:126 start_codon:yes stop_codon:yes gene_type:complete